jgi:hypothetical protein
MRAKHFHTLELESRRVSAAKSYLEFLRTPTLSLGLYVLQPCEQDLQRPHSENGVYYVIQGQARFTAGEMESPGRSGSILFVEGRSRAPFPLARRGSESACIFAPPEGTNAEMSSRAALA